MRCSSLSVALMPRFSSRTAPRWSPSPCGGAGWWVCTRGGAETGGRCATEGRGPNRTTVRGPGLRMHLPRLSRPTPLHSTTLSREAAAGGPPTSRRASSTTQPHLRHLCEQAVGVHGGGAGPRQLGRLAQRLHMGCSTCTALQHTRSVHTYDGGLGCCSAADSALRLAHAHSCSMCVAMGPASGSAALPAGLADGTGRAVPAGAPWPGPPSAAA